MEAIVKENKSLKKNMQTGAVVNTDKSAYLKARAQRKANKQLLERLDALEKRVFELEEIINK